MNKEDKKQLDRFAEKAIEGVVAKSFWYWTLGKQTSTSLAIKAFKIADAMMEERKRDRSNDPDE